MTLKLILFAAIGLFIYQFLGGKLPSVNMKRPKAKKNTKPDSDTLVECSKCGTYVTIEESTLINGKYYCDECA